MNSGRDSVVAGTVEGEVARADPPPTPLDALGEEVRRVGLQRQVSDLGLSRLVAYGALALMAVQIAAANTAFFLYGFENGWSIPVAAINAWLAATVIQVIGVVLVITRYLFPSSGSAE